MESTCVSTRLAALWCLFVLAALGLCCGLRTSLVAVYGLAALRHVGSQFPDPRSNLRPLY